MIIVNRHWFGGLATVKKLGHGLQWLLKRTEQIWPSLVWMGKDFEYHQRMIVIQNESFFNLFLWLKLFFYFWWLSRPKIEMLSFVRSDSEPVHALFRYVNTFDLVIIILKSLSLTLINHKITDTYRMLHKQETV